MSEHILQISGVNTVIIRCRQRVSGTHHDTAEATLVIALVNKHRTLSFLLMIVIRAVTVDALGLINALMR